MHATTSSTDILMQIKALDGQLDLLIKRAGQMRRDAKKITAERTRLLIAQEQVRTRVEAMIAQLKSLEQNA